MSNHLSSRSRTDVVALYDSHDFRCICGAALGAAFQSGGELALGDEYVLAEGGTVHFLSMSQAPGFWRVADESTVGLAGSRIVPECSVTLMDECARVVEALVLSERDQAGRTRATYLWAARPLQARRGYHLIRIEAAENARAAQMPDPTSPDGARHDPRGFGEQSRGALVDIATYAGSESLR